MEAVNKRTGSDDVFLSAHRASLLALAAALPLSIAASNVFLGLSLFLFAARAVRWKPMGIHRTGFEIPFAAMTAWFLLSAILNPASSSTGVFRDASLSLFFFIAAYSADREMSARCLAVYAASCAAAGLVGVFQAVSGLNWNPDALTWWTRPGWAEVLPDGVARYLALRNSRAHGFFSHPLTYAEVLVLGLGAATALRRNSRAGAASVFAGMACLAGLGASGSRGVWLALAASSPLWLAGLGKKKALAAGAAACAILLAATLLHPVLRERVSGLFRLKNDPSAQMRVAIWNEATANLRAHPLTGVGPGAFRAELRSPDGSARSWSETHNMFLQSAAETGLPGLALFVAVLFSLRRIIGKGARASGHVLLPAAFAALALAGLTESWWNDSEVVMNLFFVAGVMSLMAKGTAAQR